MRIAIMGCGYVGLVTGAGLANVHQVTLLDIDADKIAALRQGQVPIYEPGLRDLMTKNASRLHFRTLHQFEPDPSLELVLLAVGTPSSSDGSADLSAFRSALVAAQTKAPNAEIAIKSTVPVGTAELVRRDYGVSVLSIPEFLAEGTAVRDFLFPDRIVVGHGADNEDAAFAVADAIASATGDRRAVVTLVDNRTAELVKYASNTLLAARLSLVNEIADLVEAGGGDTAKLFELVGADKRIGPGFLKPGPAWGGSCFGKDVRAFARVMTDHEVSAPSLHAALTSNLRRRELIGRRCIDMSRPNAKVAILGAAFKAGTNDVRESASLDLARDLVATSRSPIVHDPHVTAADWGREMCAIAPITSDFDLAVDGAQLVVVMTEHAHYVGREAEIAALAPGATIYDARRILSPATAIELGLEYRGVGYYPRG